MDNGNNQAKFELLGIKKRVKRGEYIISTISEDGTIWCYTSEVLPVFDFGATKIFQAEEAGIAEVSGEERGDEFFFFIKGINVSKIYDYDYAEEGA